MSVELQASSAPGIAAEPAGPPSRITQTIRLEDEDEEAGVLGNCLQAAVASLLGRRLEAVPHFLAFGDLWFEALTLWAKSVGYSIEETKRIPTIPDGWCLLFGMSPRGVFHAVVGYGGETRWDPHPSRDGLLTIEERIRFVPLPCAADAPETGSDTPAPTL